MQTDAEVAAKVWQMPPPPYWPARLTMDAVPSSPFWEHFLHETDVVHHAYLVDASAGLTALYFRNDQYSGWDVGLWYERAVQHMQARMGALPASGTSGNGPGPRVSGSRVAQHLKQENAK